METKTNVEGRDVVSDKTTDWKSRKFWMCNFWGVAVSALLVFDKVPNESFEWLLTALVGGYLTSNVLDRYNLRNK